MTRDAGGSAFSGTVAGGAVGVVDVTAADSPVEGMRRRLDGHAVVVFFFFSNRLGCLGSLLLSL